MIEALGNRVIIKSDYVEGEKVSDGGIIYGVTDLEKRQAKSETSTGEIVDIGPSAWLDPILGGEPWCKVGDKVLYSKYSGKFVTDPEDSVEYVVINDDAIQARIGG